jgi:hypothetical protein
MRFSQPVSDQECAKNVLERGTKMSEGNKIYDISLELLSNGMLPG